MSSALENGHLPTGASGIPLTGFSESWWLGLSVMHTLFAREHNAVVRGAAAASTRMGRGPVYHTARLVVAALIAKIHTVEWTPAILATEDDRRRAESQLGRPAARTG